LECNNSEFFIIIGVIIYYKLLTLWLLSYSTIKGGIDVQSPKR